MTERPSHPETDEHAPDADGHDGASTSSWGTYAVVVIGVIVVLGMVALHLAGVVGPGAH